jgi:transposase
VGTPRGLLSRYEAELSDKPWEKVREDVKVKILPKDKEMYTLAESRDRRKKEKAIRHRKPRRFLSRLHELREQKSIDRDRLLKKIGAAEKDAGRMAGLIDVTIPSANESVNEDTFYWKINRKKYRNILMRDGRYLLRTNQRGIDPSDAWKQYMLLTEVDEAFRNLKGDLLIRPVYHQLERQIEAHICFISCILFTCYIASIGKGLFSRFNPRSIIEQMKVIQMIDVHIPTTDGRELTMSRYTKPDKPQQLLLTRLKFILPPSASA